MKRKIYLSGGITKIKNYKQNFAEACQYLTTLGFDCFSPPEHCKVLDDYLAVSRGFYDAYMRFDIVKLMEYPAVYMLKGWHKSKGARIEHYIARWFGMEVIYQEPRGWKTLFDRFIAWVLR